MSKLPVSVIVLTHNEQASIADCLKSVVGWAEEVFVVDSGSSDRTLAIVREFTDKVVSHPFEDYSRQRNWAQEKLPLSCDWVFHLDAGERVTPDLAESLGSFFSGRDCAQVDGLMISRRAVFMGRSILHGGMYPVYHLRVFRRDKGRCEDRTYDQHFVVEGRTRRLKGDLEDTLAPDLATWTMRHIRWASSEAVEQTRSRAEAAIAGVKPRLQGSSIERRRWLRNLYGRGPLFLRAFLYFVFRYFLLLGFLDGVEGLIFHFLHACWYRFYVDATIWEARRQTEADAR